MQFIFQGVLIERAGPGSARRYKAKLGSGITVAADTLSAIIKLIKDWS